MPNGNLVPESAARAIAAPRAFKPQFLPGTATAWRPRNGPLGTWGFKMADSPDKPHPMKATTAFLGGFILLGCGRGAVVKVAEGHYEVSCMSTAAARLTGEIQGDSTAYAQCQKRAQDLCKGPYGIKQLRSEWALSGGRWRERAQYDIRCESAAGGAVSK